MRNPVTLTVFGFAMLGMFLQISYCDEPIQLKGHEREIYCVSYSADGKTIASSSNDRTIRVWNGMEATSVIRLGYAPSKAVSLSPDGAIVAGRFETGCALWESKTGNLISKISTSSSEDGPVQRIQFSRDGKHFAAGHERGIVRIWNVAEKKVAIECRAPFSYNPASMVQCLAYHPNQDLLAVGFDHGLVLYSSLDGSRKEILSDNSTQSVAFTPDGNLLIANQRRGVGIVSIWNSATWQVLFRADQQTQDTYLGQLAPIDNSMALGVNYDGDLERFDLKKLQRTKKAFGTPYKLAPGGFVISPTMDTFTHYFGGNIYTLYVQAIPKD